MIKCPHCGKENKAGVAVCDHCKLSMKWYSMRVVNGVNAQIDIYADIGMWGITAQQFKADLDALGAVSDIEIRINSYGGEVFDGNAILNDLLAHPASKGVTITGVAASQASSIAMVASPGRLRMYDNTFLMIHDPSVGVIGNSTDLRKNADLLDKIKDNAIKAYQRHATALTHDELWDLMKDETWLSASDAKTYGLADEILGSIDALEPVTNTGRALPSNKKILLLGSKITGPKVPINKGVAMVKCPHCGKEHAEKGAFCAACGKPMDQTVAHNREIEEAKIAAQNSERIRISEITSRCENNGVLPAYRDKLIIENVPVDKAIEKILDCIQKKENLAPVQPQGGIQMGLDDSDKFRSHAVNSLAVALGSEKDKAIVAEVRKTPGPRDLHSLVRSCLAKEGKLSSGQIANLSANEIGSHAIRMASMGSSDLPAILADTMNKEFLGGFETAPTVFQEICAETENPNFMTKTMTKLSGFSDIDDLPEGTDFKQGKFSDKKETIALSTKGKALTLTRNLIVNNDTAAIASFPRGMSTAMKLKMDRDFIDLLTYNSGVGPVTTEDSVAFFNLTSHNNLIASSGVPSVASLGVADQAMMEQTLPKGDEAASKAYLNMTGSILLTGPVNRMTVLQLLGSMNDPGKALGIGTANPYFQAGIRPLFSSYLGAKAALAGGMNKQYTWYWFAGPRIYRNWVVAYLSGNRSPTLRSEPSKVGEALGISYDIFFDYKFGFEDYRGCIQNDGA